MVNGPDHMGNGKEKVLKELRNETGGNQRPIATRQGPERRWDHT